ncbi:BnaCnng29400D [Brassica napus]|uniref:BnaCnng29400D protein n=1 Tax=Brassica napus TaxID=3708 RepID=A0A078IW47_BRANA|nr:BnaCnng29400D [Brassica napus]
MAFNRDLKQKKTIMGEPQMFD